MSLSDVSSHILPTIEEDEDDFEPFNLNRVVMPFPGFNLNTGRFGITTAPETIRFSVPITLSPSYNDFFERADELITSNIYQGFSNNTINQSSDNSTPIIENTDLEVPINPNLTIDVINEHFDWNALPNMERVPTIEEYISRWETGTRLPRSYRNSSERARTQQNEFHYRSNQRQRSYSRRPTQHTQL
jgi:hypothetical protein